MRRRADVDDRSVTAWIRRAVEQVLVALPVDGENASIGELSGPWMPSRGIERPESAGSAESGLTLVTIRTR